MVADVMGMRQEAGSLAGSAVAETDRAALRETYESKRGSNHRIGMSLAVVAEIVFFVGLVFVTLAVRRSATVWPPAGSPALDLRLIALGSLALVLSAATIIAARIATVRHHSRKGAWLTAATLVLGAFFLFAQWRQFQYIGGWQTGEVVFAQLFNILSGFHALHVGIGLALLSIVLLRWGLGQVNAARRGPLDVAAVWWIFVSGIWLPLLAVVALS